MKVKTYSLGGKVTETTIEMAVAEAKPSLVAQVLRVYQARMHPHLAKTKTRGQVKLSTRKIYKQKGTGGARHGAKSAPIFVGGGIAHGPKGVKRTLLASKKNRSQALAALTQLAYKQNKIVAVSFIGLGKTKQAFKLLTWIRKDYPFTKGLVLLSPENAFSKVYFRNIKDIKVLPFNKVNAWEIYRSDLVILDAKLAGKEAKKIAKPKTQSQKKAVKKETKK